MKSENSRGRLCLGFTFFGGRSEFCSGSAFGNHLFQRRSFVEEMGSTVDDSVEDLVVISMVKELRFFFPFIVCI